MNSPQGSDLAMEIPIPPERLCLFCKHFWLDTGSRGYSEWTPGDEFEMVCEKGHWTFERYGSEEKYRTCIIAAWKCPDYVLDPNLVQEIEKAKT